MPLSVSDRRPIRLPLHPWDFAFGYAKLTVSNPLAFIFDIYQPRALLDAQSSGAR
jgi:hypothetical protein